MLEYEIIKAHYGNQKTKRSNVPLINHIKEGLGILEEIKASENAKKAYCLHPILQADESLILGMDYDFKEVNPKVIILVMEYRSVANEYLSKRVIQDIEEIRLSPLKDVNDMLIADKVQNRKDFECYHKNTHPRAKALDLYFRNWLKRLDVSEQKYLELSKYCSK